MVALVLLVLLVIVGALVLLGWSADSREPGYGTGDLLVPSSPDAN